MGPKRNGMKIRSDLKQSVRVYLDNFWRVYNEEPLIPPSKKTREFFIDNLFRDEFKKNFSIGKSDKFWNDGVLKSYMDNRRDCFHWKEGRFDSTSKLPKVNRLKHLSDEVRNDVVEVLKHYSIVDLGCHNLSDRISLLNPKKYGSVRGIVSVPKFGLKESILGITKGEYKQLSQPDSFHWDSSSMIDRNGNMWFSHSWNVIKDKNSPLFGTHFDANTISWKYLGEYYSVEYKWENEIFDLEPFSESQLKKVSEWLDYEMVSLYIFSGSKPFWNFYQDTSLGTGNYLDLLLEVCDEIGNELGFKYLFPLFYTLKDKVDDSNDLTIVSDTIQLSEEEHKVFFNQWKKRIKKRRGEWRNTKNKISEYIDIESEDWNKMVGGDKLKETREQVCFDFYKRLLPKDISEQLENE